MPALAEDRSLPLTAWMTEADLKATFDGKSVEGEYPSGLTFKEEYKSGGKVSYEDEGHASAGHWSIKAGSFCTIYEGDSSGGCFRVRKSGKNCYEFFFVARTEKAAETKDDKTPSWTARAWLDTEDSTCKQEIGA